MVSAKQQRLIERGKAFRGRMKVHEITISVRFDTEITGREARYALWNHIHGDVLYGDGKPDKHSARSQEPYGVGKIHVPLARPKR